MRRNINLYYAYKVISNFVTLYAIWYSFESRLASVFTISLIYASNRLLTLVLELPTGALADLIGRKNTLSMGYFLSGLSWIVLGAYPHLLTLWLAYMINGVGEAFISGSDTALLYDSLKSLKHESRFAKITTKVNLLMRLSIIAGIVIGGYVFDWWPGLPYILFGLSYLLAGSVSALSQEPQVDSEVFSLKTYILQIKTGVNQLFQSSTTRLFSLFYVVNGGITWYFSYVIYTIWLTQLIVSNTNRSWIMAGITVLAGLVLVVIPQLISKFTAQNMTLLFGFGTSVALLLAGFSVGLPLVFVFVLYTLSIARFSFLDQVANDFFLSKYRATALSTLNMGVSLVFVIISLTGGWVLQTRTLEELLLGLGVISLTLSLPIIWKLRQEMVQ